LLASPDRRTTTGLRDYAVLVLLSRLGLRAGEVAGLRLDDFDWRAATLIPTVKGGGRLQLPIPADVGPVLVAYLRRRPAGTTCREVFVQVRGEPKPMTSRAVTQVVARRGARVGLGSVRAHRLRHSAARAVLVVGGSLSEVGELLGHANGQVGMIYASFGQPSLGWSGRGRRRPTMSELPTLVSAYVAFRAARGFQPNRKLERLLTQFAESLPPSRLDGRLFSQGEALAWAHAPGGAAPAWVAYRLSAVRQFAVYLADSGLPVGDPGTRQGPGGSRRATPYLFTDTDVQAVMRAAEELFSPLRAATMTTLVGVLAVTGMRIGERCGSPSPTSIWTRASS
jgi:integrase